MGEKTGPNPTDRRKRGSQHHVLTDAQGVPLAALVTGAHRHDVTQLLPLLEAIPPVRGKCGRSRRRPRRVPGDRGYDAAPHRQALRALGITPVLATRAHRAWQWPGSLAGSWNEPWPGCRHGAGCGYAMRGVPTGMKPFSRGDVH